MQSKENWTDNKRARNENQGDQLVKHTDLGRPEPRIEWETKTMTKTVKQRVVVISSVEQGGEVMS